MGTLRRIEKLERVADDEIDWRDYLPEGVTVAEAEAFLETWARLAADYTSAHGGSIETAIDVALGQAVALVESGDTLEDDDDDEH